MMLVMNITDGHSLNIGVLKKCLHHSNSLQTDPDEAHRYPFARGRAISQPERTCWYNGWRQAGGSGLQNLATRGVLRTHPIMLRDF